MKTHELNSIELQKRIKSIDFFTQKIFQLWDFFDGLTVNYVELKKKEKINLFRLNIAWFRNVRE